MFSFSDLSLRARLGLDGNPGIPNANDGALDPGAYVRKSLGLDPQQSENLLGSRLPGPELKDGPAEMRLLLTDLSQLQNDLRILLGGGQGLGSAGPLTGGGNPGYGFGSPLGSGLGGADGDRFGFGWSDPDGEDGWTVRNTGNQGDGLDFDNYELDEDKSTPRWVSEDKN